MAVRQLARSVSAAVLVAGLSIGSTGCGAPEPSYTSLSDEAVKNLFPTDAEIKSALGGDYILTAPLAMQPAADYTPPANEGLSPECHEAVYGGAKPAPPSRIFMMESTGPEPHFLWAITQWPSPEDTKTNVNRIKSRIEKCGHIEPFVSDVATGISYLLLKSPDGLVTTDAAHAVVINGDVEIMFIADNMPVEESKAIAMKMAPVMEKRLKASAPKE